jgi:hypothetical protein
VHQQQQQRLTADGQTKRLLLHLQQSVLQILRGARAFRCAAAAAGKVVSVCMRLFYMRAAAAATFSREKPLLNKRTVSAWCILQPTNDHQLVFKRVQRTKPHSLCERSGKLSNHNSWAALSRCRARHLRDALIFSLLAPRRHSSDLRFSMHLILIKRRLLTKETSHTPAKRHSRPLTAPARSFFNKNNKPTLLCNSAGKKRMHVNFF